MSEVQIWQELETMGEMLVLAQPTDLPVLADLHTHFQNLENWASSNGHPEVACAAKVAAGYLEKVILDEVSEPVATLESVGAAVSVIQSIVRDGREASAVTWPPGFEDAGACEPAPRAPEVGLPEPAPLQGDPDLLREFVAEASEHLEAAEMHLLTLETDPGNQEALNAVFRGFHTIKGVAGFLSLDQILTLAHEAENLLDKARKKELELRGSAIDASFDAVDMLKVLVGHVSGALSGGGLLAVEPSQPALVDKLKRIAAGEPVEKGAVLPAAPGAMLGEILVESGLTTTHAVDAAIDRQHKPQPAKKIGEVLVESGQASPVVVQSAVELQKQNPELGKTGEILREMGAVTDESLKQALDKQQQAGPGRLGRLLAESGEVAARDVAQALRTQKLQQQTGQIREAVKVDADRLDQLVDMIGELVIAESMVVQAPELQGSISTELARHLNQLDKITRELQEMGTSLRMVPIRATFQKMARLARDLAKKSGKNVEFITTGEDTELDKTVVDKIGDPLVHMIRNSVDHGLEPDADSRVRAGKTPEGHVHLRAFHKGGSIYIEIEDDGRGLDRDAILTKARERGLVKETDSLSDREIYNLIFLPGFSTAKTITDVSGRGVGMDVVRRNIESLRGQIEIQTEQGRGTIISIRLPLTLAIIDGMVVRVDRERYIIPTLSIVTSLRPTPNQLSRVVGKGDVLQLQGRLLPLFRLANLFDLQGASADLTSGIVMVVEDEGRQTGILVDEILGQQQIVIKSLGEALQGSVGIAGGAIMADGAVGLILDIGGLVRLANDAFQDGSEEVA